MSLSKVYSSPEGFQPEEIITSGPSSAPEFGEIVNPVFEKQGPAAEILPRHDTTQDQAASEVPAPPTPNSIADDQPQTAPADASEYQDAEAIEVVAPDPGIPPERVEEMIQEAFDKGVATGREQAEEDFGSASNSLLLVCQQLDELRDTILKNSIGEIQDLVLAISDKIIRHSIAGQKETVLATIEEAIQKAVKSDEFQIFVNPDDYQIISAKAEELMSGMSGLRNLVVHKDPQVEPGGCRLESENCTVDATVLSQLEVIEHHLKQEE